MATRPTISITTDFGHQGPFVAIMKAVIAGRCPAANVIDVTHDIPVHWPPEAGFWLARAYRWFPKNTVHIAVVDPGVGTERDLLAAEVDGHRFLAPDNGLLGELLDAATHARVVRIDIDGVRRHLGLPVPSMTFHGRDLFAPVAAELAAGQIALAQLGPTHTDWVPSQLDAANASGSHIAGSIVTIDTFGNLISNIAGSDVGRFENPVVHLAGLRLPLLATYGRAMPGDYLALINSFDVLEVARAESSAADGLGVARGAPIRVSQHD